MREKEQELQRLPQIFHDRYTVGAQGYMQPRYPEDELPTTAPSTRPADGQKWSDAPAE